MNEFMMRMRRQSNERRVARWLEAKGYCFAVAPGQVDNAQADSGQVDGEPAAPGGGGGSVVLSGTITAATTEANIVAGGKTIILTLTGDTWLAAGGAFDGERQNIIDGIDSAQAEAAGWDAVVKATLAVSAVVRTSATVVTITLPAFGSFNITATETVTATVPGTALTGGVALVAAPTFTVAAAGAPSAALTGTIASGTTEANIVSGGRTLILTLTGDTWVAAGATFDAQRAAIRSGLDSAQAEATGWDAVVKPAIPLGNIVRTSNTVVTITVPAFGTYNITATETITATIPAAALTGGVAIVAAPTFTITATVAGPTTVTLSAGPTTGTTGVVSTNFTATLNAVATAPVNVAPHGTVGTVNFSTPPVIPIGSTTTTWTATALSDGTHVITITNDAGLTNAGSINYVTTTLNVTFDKTAPFISSDGTPPGTLGTVVAQAFKNVAGTGTATGAAPTVNTVTGAPNGRQVNFSLPPNHATNSSVFGTARWNIGSTGEFFAEPLNIPPSVDDGGTTGTVTSVCDLPTGTDISGTIGLQVYDAANAAVGAHITTNIWTTPLVTGPSKFARDLTLPFGTYHVVWDNGSGVFGTAQEISVERPAPIPPTLVSRAVSITLVDSLSNPLAGLSGLSWSTRDVASPNLPGTVADEGSGATTDGSGTFSVTAVMSSLASGQSVWFDVFGPGGKVAAGPVVLS